MLDFHFKKGGYKYYAPILYKIYRFKANLKLLLWAQSRCNLDALAQHYWDCFLAQKFEQELQSRGHDIYTLPQRSSVKNQDVYILGSGASINEVDQEQWNHISENYSIGLNNFYVHPFVANTYFCEFANNPEFLKLIYEHLLNDKKKANSVVNLAGKYILFRGQGYKKPEVQSPNFYVSRSIRITSKSVLIKLLKSYYAVKCKFITHHISNLDSAINYAVKCGYKNIFLVGVDLYGDNYFWDDSDDPIYEKAQTFIHSFRQQMNYQKDKNGRHATASNSVANKLGKLTIVEYLELLQTEILSDMGIQLWVSNPNSLLATVLPVKIIPKTKAS